MQRVSLALLLVAIAAPAWAQAAIPGTFRTAPLQANQSLYTPLLTPPEISYGAGGLSGPVVVNQQVLTPTFSLASAAPVASETIPNEQALTVAQAAANSRALSAQAKEKERFDYIIAPGVGTAAASSSAESLGELAASLRKGPPPTQHNFTNDDIGRMNGASNGSFEMPANSAPSPQDKQQVKPTPPQPQKNQTEMIKKQHSPFSPPAMAAEE